MGLHTMSVIMTKPALYPLPIDAESLAMPEDIIECTEIAGKVVKCLKLYPADPDAAELQIDFEDGTSFSCILENKPVVKASLIRTGVGTPEVVRDYIP